MQSLKDKERSIVCTAIAIFSFELGCAGGTYWASINASESLRQWGTIVISAAALAFGADQLIRTRKQLSINIEKHTIDRLALLAEQAKSRIATSQQYAAFASKFAKNHDAFVESTRNNPQSFESASSLMDYKQVIKVRTVDLRSLVSSALSEIIDPEVFMLLTRTLDIVHLCQRNLDDFLTKSITAAMDGNVITHDIFLRYNGDLLLALMHLAKDIAELNKTLHMRALEASDRYSIAVGEAR